MKILNAIEKLRDAGDGAVNATANEGLSILLRLLSPITPHIAHALWRELGFGEDVMLAPWPEPDPAALEQDEIEYVVQVNGKLRGSIKVAKSADKKIIEDSAVAAMVKHVTGSAIKKIIVVPGRLVNIVV
jgi:leucyl-tRNA synthetase